MKQVLIMRISAHIIQNIEAVCPNGERKKPLIEAVNLLRPFFI